MSASCAPSVPSATRFRRVAAPLGAVVATAAGAAYLRAVDPNVPGHYPLCPVYAATGLYCPGCGLLRAGHDLLVGDLGGAMARNPLAPFVAVLGLALLALWVRARWRGDTVSWDPPRWFPWAFAAGFVVFMIARNIPGWTLLSPA